MKMGGIYYEHEDKSYECIIIRGSDDYEEYLNWFKKRIEEMVRTLLRSGEPQDRFDHLIQWKSRKPEHSILSLSISRAKLNGSNVYVEIDKAYDTYMRSLLDIVFRNDVVAVTCQGGFRPVTEDLLSNEQEFDLESFGRSGFNTMIINQPYKKAEVKISSRKWKNSDDEGGIVCYSNNDYESLIQDMLVAIADNSCIAKADAHIALCVKYAMNNGCKEKLVYNCYDSDDDDDGSYSDFYLFRAHTRQLTDYLDERLDWNMEKSTINGDLIKKCLDMFLELCSNYSFKGD
jgi:hypothetical protein